MFSVYQMKHFYHFFKAMLILEVEDLAITFAL